MNDDDDDDDNERDRIHDRGRYDPATALASGPTSPANFYFVLAVLLVSGFIGVTVGDIFWLQAVREMGARRVIMVDSLKPFLGTLL